jgi:hypothetical protein
MYRSPGGLAPLVSVPYIGMAAGLPSSSLLQEMRHQEISIYEIGKKYASIKPIPI